MSLLIVQASSEKITVSADLAEKGATVRLNGRFFMLNSAVETVFFIQFYIPFKIISAHMRRVNRQMGQKTGEPLRKTTWHTRK